MYNWIKFLTILIVGIIVFGVTGCSSNRSNMPNNTNVNLNKLNITYPSDWTKKGNANEIFFEDKNKQTIAGISLIGYNGDYGSTLPNHSETLKSEDINTSLGKGKLFTLKRSNPAASNDSTTWTEVHAIIPYNKNNLAYDFWIKGRKNILLDILKSIK